MLFLLVSLQTGWCESPEKDAVVSIYDDFDDGRFGRSEHRGVIRSVKLSALSLYKTLPVASPAWDETSHLTAVVLSEERAQQIFSGKTAAVQRDSPCTGVYIFSRDGVEFSFSLERPDSKVLAVLDEYYSGPWENWREPVRQHYRENYIIRVYSAVNVFEPWNETVSYNEALLMATLIGDRDQWLWGIYNGLDLLMP